MKTTLQQLLASYETLIILKRVCLYVGKFFLCHSFSFFMQSVRNPFVPLDHSEGHAGEGTKSPHFFLS